MNLGVIDAALDSLQLLLWRRRNPGKGDIVLLKQDLPSPPPPLLLPRLLQATATEMNSKAIQRRMEENSYHNFNFGDSSNVVRRRRTSTGGSGSGSVGEVGGPVDQATESQRLEALVTLMNVDIQV